jgi:hypothetical protein
MNQSRPALYVNTLPQGDEKIGAKNAPKCGH